MGLSDSLQELLEHGYEGVRGMSYFSCMPLHVSKQVEKSKGDCVAWRLMLHYYHVKVPTCGTQYIIRGFL